MHTFTFRSRGKKFFRAIVFLSLPLLAGCRTAKLSDFNQDFFRKHVVSISKTGAPKVVENGKYEVDKLQRHQEGTYPGTHTKVYQQDVKAMCDAILAEAPVRDGKRQVMIFAHGGLNTEASRLGRVADVLVKNGGIKNYYPIFINWESGLISSYGEHLLTVRQGDKFRPAGPLGAWLSPLILTADLGKSLAKTPRVWVSQFNSDAKGFSFSKGGSAARSSARLEEAFVAAPPPRFDVQHHRADQTSTGQTLWSLTSYGLTLPVKLVTTPIIDGFGGSAWDMMYRRTETMFRSVYEFDLAYGARFDNSAEVMEATKPLPTGAMAILLEAFSKHLNPKDYQITLVGHSMGAIVMNGVLRHYPNLPYRRIVYMGAAGPISELETSLVPVMLKNPEVTFRNWCLSPKSEHGQTSAWDLAPRGSLLVWIDYYFANPRYPTDRTVGSWENITQAAHIFPPEVRNRITLETASFQPSGQASEPQKHGDFANKFWESVRREIENGTL